MLTKECFSSKIDKKLQPNSPEKVAFNNMLHCESVFSGSKQNVQAIRIRAQLHNEDAEKALGNNEICF